MPVMSFEEDMRDAVHAIAAAHSMTDQAAFGVWYCEVAFGLDRQEAIDAARYDGGNDRGVDILWVDDELQRILICQAKYFGSGTRSPRPADLALLLDTPDALDDPQSLRDDGRPDLAEAAEDFKLAVAAGYTVRLQVVYPGPGRVGLDAQVRTFNRRYGREDLTAEIVSLDGLEQMHAEFMGNVGRIEAATLDLVPGSSYEQRGSYGRAMVATVPGSTLKALYEAHHDRLFDQNVRLALPARKGSVNAAILETIQSAADRSNFWAYNNGVTIVARSFRRRTRRSQVEISQFSIVNGCQTTVLIGGSDSAAVDDVQLLLRVVAAPNRLVDNIIRYTNSQTPIRPWEMSVRDRDQQRLRRELDALPQPWYYAQRRGEFETVANKDRYGPADDKRVLKFPQTVQFLAAFRGLPVEAYKDKARLFTAHKDRVMPPDTSASDLLWAWHVGKAVIQALPQVRQTLVADDRAQAILKRGSHFFASSMAAHMLRSRNGADYTTRVDCARLSDTAMAERLSKYATTALISYVRATANMLRAGRDLGVLLRSPETNTELHNYVEEQMVEERLTPRNLDEKLPLLPGIARA